MSRKLSDKEREELKELGIIPKDFSFDLNTFKDDVINYLKTLENTIGIKIPFTCDINEHPFLYRNGPEYYIGVKIVVYLHPTKEHNYNSIFPDGICLEPLRIQDFRGFLVFDYTITQTKYSISKRTQIICNSMQNIDITRINFTFTGCTELTSGSEYVSLTSKFPMGKNVNIDWTDKGKQKLTKVLVKTINNVNILKDCYKPMYESMNNTFQNNLKLLKIAQKKYNIGTSM